jgi:hypothetical protein
MPPFASMNGITASIRELVFTIYAAPIKVRRRSKKQFADIRFCNRRRWCLRNCVE